MKKLILSIGVALCVAVSALAAGTQTIDGRDWTYTVSGGEATIIYVEGPMSGEVAIPATLGGYPVAVIGEGAFEGCSRLRSVALPDSLKKIGALAFQDCTALTSVTIPAGVTEVGEGAFAGCTGLKSATVPQCVCDDGLWFAFDADNITKVVIAEGATALGDYAFEGCYNLTLVTIPNTVQYIGDHAFDACYSLKRAAIPEGVEEIGAAAFMDCFDLESVTLPSSLTSIGETAFAGCISLTGVTLPDGLTSIGASAFEDCCSLSRLTLPAQLETIGSGAFRNSGLTGAELPDSVTDIGEGVFAGCAGLSQVTITQKILDLGVRNVFDTNLAADIVIADDVECIPDGAFEGFGKITGVVISDGVEEIRNRAFYDCRSLESLEIPESVHLIGAQAFGNCYGLKHVIGVDCVGINNGVFGFEDSSKPRLWETVVVRDGERDVSGFAGMSNLVSVTLPCSVRCIGDRAFYECPKLQSVTIADGVAWSDDPYGGDEWLHRVGESAFEGCRSLTYVDIPDDVYEIGYRAFYGCAKLTDVVLPDTVEAIDDYAFYGCGRLKSINFPEGAKRVDPYGPPEGYYHGGMHRIGRSAFENCVSLTVANIPSYLGDYGGYYGADEICDRAFANCYSLKEVTLPGAVFRDYYRDGESRYVFGPAAVFELDDSSRSRLWEKVTIGEGAPHIGGFENCPNLRSVVLPKSVRSFRENAFRNCERLESVTIAEGESGDDMDPNSCKIGDCAFADCRNLTHVDIPDGVREIGRFAFSNCNRLTDVSLPESVSVIGEYAFQNCYLNEIFLPRSVSVIGNWAFDYPSRIVVDWGDTERIKSLLQSASITVSSTTFVERCDDSIVISPDELPEGDVGEPYVARLSVSGGTGPYTWELRNVNADYVERREYSTFSLNGTAKNWSGSNNCWSYKLPFEFPFYGRTYSKVYVSSSGALTFDTYCYSVSDERELRNRVMIAPLWRDWYMENIYVSEADNSVTIRWCGSNSKANFSATLCKDGTIRLSYGLGNGSGGLIGISAGDGQNYFCRQVVSVMTHDRDIVMSVPPLDMTLSADGILSGVPTSAASYVVTVAVTDAPGSGTLKEYSLVVNGGFSVSFDLGEQGVRTGGGELEQTVKKGGAAIAPEVTANEGWHFIGWDKTFDSVSGDMTVTARYASVPYENGVYTETVDGLDWTFTVSDGKTFVGGGPGSPAILKSTAGAVSIPRTLGGGLVTGIGPFAFEGCANLTHVDIPEGVEWIGREAFRGCAKLADVTLPGSVREIMNSAFDGCRSLTTADIPDSVERIGDGAFANCYGLKHLIIPACEGSSADVFRFDDPSRPRLWETVIFQDGVTHVGGFAGCSNLVSVTLPASVICIEDGAFYSCPKLERVTVEDGLPPVTVEVYPDERRIGMAAFEGCTSLTHVDIPNGVMMIYDHAFCGCTKLKELKLTENVFYIEEAAFLGCASLVDVGCLDGLGWIGRSAFEGCRNLTRANLPDWLGEIGERAFANCYALRDVTLPACVFDWGLENVFGLDPESIRDPRSGLACMVPRPRLWEHVVVGEGVTVVEGFGGCSNLVSVTLPASVTGYRDHAFYACPKLESVTISGGLPPAEVPDNWDNVRVGMSAFEGCSSLTHVDIPECVKYIEERAFYGCAKLAAVEIPDGVLMIGQEAFRGCTSLVRADIPESVVDIEGFAFSDCRVLASAILPEGLGYLGERAFANCYALRDVTLPACVFEYGMEDVFWLDAESVRDPWGGPDRMVPRPRLWEHVVIGDGVTVVGGFAGCSNLVSVTLPASVTGYDHRAFYSCPKLESVTISGGLPPAEVPDNWDNVRVGMSAFEGCSSLTHVDIPECVKYIESRAFFGCAKLADMTLPEGVLLIEQEAFRGCTSLVRADIPESVEHIDNFAFSDCRVLAAVNLPEGLEYIGNRAFANCYALRDVTLPACVFEYGMEDVFWLDAESVRDPWGGPDRMVPRPRLWEHVVVGDGVTVVEGFAGCSNLVSVTLPASVTGYGYRAFYSCPKLESVTIRDGLPSAEVRNDYYDVLVSESAFEGCASLTRVDIPESVKYIVNRAFCGCAKLTEVEIPDGVLVIGCEAFLGCVSLVRADIPESVLQIDTDAFWGCSALKNVTLPKCVSDTGLREIFGFDPGVWQVYGLLIRRCAWESVTLLDGWTAVDDNLFAGLQSLKSVTLPASVRTIGAGAFSDCVGLRDMTFGGNAPSAIGVDAFSGISPDCTAWVKKGSTGWGAEIAGRWQGMKIDYQSSSLYLPSLSYGANVVAMQTDRGWTVASANGSVLTRTVLTSLKVNVTLPDGSEVETTKGYEKALSEDGTSVEMRLKTPEVALAAETGKTDEDDPSGLLVDVPEALLATKPAAGEGESVGALPVKAVKGLWYQASWGDGLQNMTQGEKVQATGDSLYLGVIKQTGASGFYRLSVSEK